MDLPAIYLALNSYVKVRTIDVMNTFIRAKVPISGHNLDMRLNVYIHLKVINKQV